MGRIPLRRSAAVDPATRGAAVPGAALHRQLEEFPWATDGLSRWERQVLDALKAGRSRSRAFPRTHEEPVFLGDTVLAWHVERMEPRCRAGSAVTRSRTKRCAGTPRYRG